MFAVRANQFMRRYLVAAVCACERQIERCGVYTSTLHVQNHRF